MIDLSKSYKKHFKTKAINKVLINNSPVKGVAKELEIPLQTLYGWISSYNENNMQQLKEENSILKDAWNVPKDKESIFDFIYNHKDIHPISTMCKLLNVSASGYYKHIKSVSSAQELHYKYITRLTKDVYTKKGPNIGSPEITKILNKEKVITSQATVARILKENKSDWHASYSHFHDNKDVILHFNNKDTVFDSNTDTFYHEELGQEQIKIFLNNIYFGKFSRYKGNTNTKVQTFSKNDNLLIHGDNLHALHHLKDTFSKSLQLIYIDVPYRTMRNNLSYYDGFSRSDYLLLLKNRLEIGRVMLKSTGAIFIQCSDEEQAYIKGLCDEIFGENNFINQIIWQRTKSQQNISHIATKKEYILVYAKNKKQVRFNRRDSNQLETYKYKDSKGTFRIDKIRDAKNGYYNYVLETPAGHVIDSQWMYSHNTFKELESLNLIYWSKYNIPYKKVYLSEDKPKQVVVNDLWIDDAVYGTTREATLELEKLVGPNDFTYPKPEKLLENIIELATNQGDTVLDFYAGSGTTAASAYKLNRQFILVEKDFDNFNLIIKRMQKVIANPDILSKTNDTFITGRIEQE